MNSQEKNKIYINAKDKTKAQIMRELALKRHRQKVQEKIRKERERMAKIEEENRKYREAKNKEELKTKDVIYLSEKNFISTESVNNAFLKKIKTNELEDLIHQKLKNKSLADIARVEYEIPVKKDIERKKKFQKNMEENKKKKKDVNFYEKYIKPKLQANLKTH
ncbi:MAG: hypothetical protein E7G36_05160 [Peptoniphilus rhinitidis]|uniref:hypothetical protein n=1 Tax=Peptoniphilus rhinitidis TaxID=1175452 RepID=UPI0028FF162C|nr:hypothetical protein [Peptoniphilus rhinitidis]MDU2109912.1 hypothetical protein [Peptoniphilus lacydonensis]MDU3751094.1 hypothetical protein [Peptoniphilus rhinitidis]